ncbi:MAG: hypothetical protein ACRDTD_28770 [Pseudonocardiaceae bacterium]
MSVPGESGPSIAADPDEDMDACPYCRETSGVQVITDTPPTVHAWSCQACGTEWALTVVNPHLRPFLDQLAVDVAARAVLREVTTLAEQADTLTQGERRARLIGCLARLDQVCCHSAAASGFPAGRRSNQRVPGTQPVPDSPVADSTGIGTTR